MTFAIKLLCLTGALALTAQMHADQLLVASDLYNAQFGAVICPEASNCSVRRQDFNLTTSVTVYSIAIAMAGPPDPGVGLSSTPFSVALVDKSTNQTLFTGSSLFDYSSWTPNSPPVVNYITFYLDLSLDPGSYYFSVYANIFSGQYSNTMWGYALPVTTTEGTLGTAYSCDAFGCSAWSPQGKTFAMAIDGVDNVPTPEPSSLLLLGTGSFVGLVCCKRSLS